MPFYIETRPSEMEVSPLLDYQSPYFQLKFPLDHRIPGNHQISLDHTHTSYSHFK